MQSICGDKKYFMNKNKKLGQGEEGAIYEACSFENSRLDCESEFLNLSKIQQSPRIIRNLLPFNSLTITDNFQGQFEDDCCEIFLVSFFFSRQLGFRSPIE